MKSLLLFTIISIAFIHLGVNNVDAMCAIDTDWPGKPCIDTSPPLPLSKSEWKQLWTEYYTLKGSNWMEQQKTELDKQIKSDTLKEWIESGYDAQDFKNYNVWFYFYLNDLAPAPEGYAIDESNYEVDIVAPLKQIKSGIQISQITCRDSLILITKYDGSPACVKPETKTRLIERGWALSIPLEEKEAINLIKNQYPQLQDFPSDDLPPKTIRAEKSSDGWYVIFETQGSGLPTVIEAQCFLVDNSKTVTPLGQYKNAGEIKTNISLKTCS